MYLQRQRAIPPSRTFLKTWSRAFVSAKPIFLKGNGKYDSHPWIADQEYLRVNYLSVKLHESSLDIADRNPKIKTALTQLEGYFISLVNEKVPKKEWMPVCQDIKELLAYFGIKE
jgi:hypothetical protein